MFEKWRERRAAKLAKEIEERDRRLRDEEDAYRERLEKLRDEMTSQPCAVRGMENCSRECVHFNAGRIAIDPYYFEDGPIAYFENPSCKLWK